MLTLNELSEQLAAYKDDRLSFAEFENWFEDNCAGAYEVRDLREACIAVDAALSQYHFDHTEEASLKVELENAIRPFVLHAAEARAVQLVEFAPNNGTRAGTCRGENANEPGSAGHGQSIGSNSTWHSIPAEV